MSTDVGLAAIWLVYSTRRAPAALAASIAFACCATGSPPDALALDETTSTCVAPSKAWRRLCVSSKDALTTHAVAAEAGIQAPTIYRLFGDKDGLLEAVAEDGARVRIASWPVAKQSIAAAQRVMVFGSGPGVAPEQASLLRTRKLTCCGTINR